jgi:hypothetical protein
MHDQIINFFKHLPHLLQQRSPLSRVPARIRPLSQRIQLIRQLLKSLFDHPRPKLFVRPDELQFAHLEYFHSAAVENNPMVVNFSASGAGR